MNDPYSSYPMIPNLRGNSRDMASKLETHLAGIRVEMEHIKKQQQENADKAFHAQKTADGVANKLKELEVKLGQTVELQKATLNKLEQYFNPDQVRNGEQRFSNIEKRLCTAEQTEAVCKTEIKELERRIQEEINENQTQIAGIQNEYKQDLKDTNNRIWGLVMTVIASMLILFFTNSLAGRQELTDSTETSMGKISQDYREKIINLFQFPL